MRNLSLAVVLLLAACQPEQSDLVPPEVLVGTASDGYTFEERHEAEAVRLQRGPQGGYHFFLHFRSRGLKKGLFDVVYSSQAAAGGPTSVVGKGRGYLLDRDSDEWLESDHGLLTIVCPSERPVGVPYRFDVAATDAGGRYASDAVVLIPTCPEGDALCPLTCTSNIKQ
jgi:hypothetical protein